MKEAGPRVQKTRRVTPTTLAIHAHFYQPPRENPWTEEVQREPSAAPFHDWNARISAECYRPNAYARIVDAEGRDAGPGQQLPAPVLQRGADPDVLAGTPPARRLHPHPRGRPGRRWRHRPGLEPHDPPPGQRPGRPHPGALGPGRLPPPLRHRTAGHVAAGDGRERRHPRRAGRGGRGVHHPRPGPGPGRPRPGRRPGPAAVPTGVATPIPIDTRVPYRWLHPAGDGRGVDIVFYDGALSATTSLSPTSPARSSSTGLWPAEAAEADWSPSPSTARPSATTTSGSNGAWPTPSPARVPAGAWRSTTSPAGWPGTGPGPGGGGQRECLVVRPRCRPLVDRLRLRHRRRGGRAPAVAGAPAGRPRPGA